MWRPLNCKAICVQLCNTHTVFTNAFSVKYWVMELKSCKRRKRNGKIKGNCNTICAKRSAKCIQIFLNHGTDGYSQDNSVLDEVCILDKKVLTILVLRSWSSRNVSSVQHDSIVNLSFMSEIFPLKIKCVGINCPCTFFVNDETKFDFRRIAADRTNASQYRTKNHYHTQ